MARKSALVPPPPEKMSPRNTRLRPRRVAEQLEQQEPTPAPPATRTRATTMKPAAKSTAAPKAASKAGSKSYRVTKPRGKAAAKSKKRTTTDDTPTEPPSDPVETEDHDDDAAESTAEPVTKTPAKPAKGTKARAKTPAKTPAKTRSTKKAKSYEPEQQLVRATRRSVQSGWQSPLSDQAQNIMGLLPQHLSEPESTPLSIVEDAPEQEVEKEEQWFEQSSPKPYAFAQESAQKPTVQCENEFFPAQFRSSISQLRPAPLSSSPPYCPSTVSQIAGVPYSDGRAQALLEADWRARSAVSPCFLVPSSQANDLEPMEALPARPSPPRSPSPCPSPRPDPKAQVSAPRADSLSPRTGTGEGSPSPDSHPVVLTKMEVEAVLQEVEGLIEAGASFEALVQHCLGLDPLVAATAVATLATKSKADVVEAAASDAADADDADDADEPQDALVGQHDDDDNDDDDDDDEAMTDGSDEAMNGQDEEMVDAPAADEDAPPEEPAQTTPTSSYYLSGLFTTGKNILSMFNPWAARAPSASSTSPTPVRSLRKPGPVTPRIKNADQRHAMAVANKEKSDQIRREREEQEAMEQEAMAQEAIAQEAVEQATGDGRKYMPWDIFRAKYCIPVPEDEDDDDYGIESSTVLTPATKRQKMWEQIETEDPRLKQPVDIEGTKEFQHLETTLQRPRNSLRRAFKKETGKDLGDKHHQTKIQHHENSFSRTPLRDSQSSVNKRPANDLHPAPSTVYSGSTFALPGDPGYKANVFRSSDMQATIERREKMSKREERAAKMKARGEEIALKEWDKRTPEEDEFLEKCISRFGHIKGSGGSFSCPEGSDNDTESDTDTSVDDEPVASTGFKPVTATTMAPSDKPLIGILKKPAADNAADMVPPPTPKPANAQLPATTEAQGTPKAAGAELPTEPQAAVTSNKPANTLIHDVYLDRPRAGPDAKESIARARRNAEKHRPTKPSNLQYVERVASSPIQPTGETTNPMSNSLIIQDMGLPAAQNDTATAVPTFGSTVRTVQTSSLPWETSNAAQSSAFPWTPRSTTQPAASSSLSGNGPEAANAFSATFASEIQEASRDPASLGHKRKRSTEELESAWSNRAKTQKMGASADEIIEQVPKALSDSITSDKDRLTAAIPSELNSSLSPKRRAVWDSRWAEFLAREQAAA